MGRRNRDKMREAAERMRRKSDSDLQPVEPRSVGEPLDHSMASGQLPSEIECPDCAEVIKARAKVCRYCGCEIGVKRKRSSGRNRAPRRSVAPVQPDSACMPLLCGFLITGLGHLVAGEIARGACWFVVAVVFAVLFWPAAVIVWVASICDAAGAPGRVARQRQKEALLYSALINGSRRR